jgi:HAUS augmin-like complex subunit 1
MDTSSDWAASALFSPSKARVQQAQAKDWAAVDAWLAKRYGAKRPPAFEKNEDTLQALLTLASLNDSADEQRAQLDRIEKTTLSSLSKKPTGLAQDILQTILAQLSNDESLETYAELIVALESRSTDALEIGKDIIALTNEDFDAKQQLIRANAQLAALRGERSHLAKTLEQLRGEAFQTPSDMIDNTNSWNASVKKLKAKIGEYDERLAASGSRANANSRTGSNGLEMVQSLTAENERQMATLEKLEAQLEALQELPPDVKAARGIVERAREELRGLTERRDHRFEELAKA